MVRQTPTTESMVNGLAFFVLAAVSLTLFGCWALTSTTALRIGLGIWIADTALLGSVRASSSALSAVALVLSTHI